MVSYARHSTTFLSSDVIHKSLTKRGSSMNFSKTSCRNPRFPKLLSREVVGWYPADARFGFVRMKAVVRYSDGRSSEAQRSWVFPLAERYVLVVNEDRTVSTFLGPQDLSACHAKSQRSMHTYGRLPYLLNIDWCNLVLVFNYKNYNDIHFSFFNINESYFKIYRFPGPPFIRV